MSFKFLLAALLVIAIGVFVLYSIKFNNKERESLIELQSRRNQESDRYVSKAWQTKQANPQADRLLNNLQSEAGMPSSGQSSGSTTQQQTSETHSKIYYVNIGQHYGCVDQSTLHKLLRYYNKGDTKKYDALLQKGLAEGNIVTFKPGEQVLLQETDPVTGEVRIGKTAITQSYWTPYATID